MKIEFDRSDSESFVITIVVLCIFVFSVFSVKTCADFYSDCDEQKVEEVVDAGR